MPPEMAICWCCGRERPINEMPVCQGRCGRRFCGECFGQADTCLNCCAAHAFAPRDPLAGVPDPDLLRGEVARAAGWLQCVPDLIRLADDLACWSETLDPASCGCDTATLADIEALGVRAHDIMRRLSAEEEASS